MRVDTCGSRVLRLRALTLNAYGPVKSCSCDNFCARLSASAIN